MRLPDPCLPGFSATTRLSSAAIMAGRGARSKRAVPAKGSDPSRSVGTDAADRRCSEQKGSLPVDGVIRPAL